MLRRVLVTAGLLGSHSMFYWEGVKSAEKTPISKKEIKSQTLSNVVASTPLIALIGLYGVIEVGETIGLVAGPLAVGPFASHYFAFKAGQYLTSKNEKSNVENISNKESKTPTYRR